MYDDWGMVATATQSFTPTVETGRLISLVYDPTGFAIRAQVATQSSVKALRTARHDGLKWEDVHTSTTLQKPALALDTERGRILRVAQVIASKAWVLESSNSLGSDWEQMSAPFDSTYKVVTRPCFGPITGEALIVGISSTNVLTAKISRDGGASWSTDGMGSISSSSKSVDLSYDTGRSRFVLVADNLQKTSSDTGASWQDL